MSAASSPLLLRYRACSTQVARSFSSRASAFTGPLSSQSRLCLGRAGTTSSRRLHIVSPSCNQEDKRLRPGGDDDDKKKPKHQGEEMGSVFSALSKGVEIVKNRFTASTAPDSISRQANELYNRGPPEIPDSTKSYWVASTEVQSEKIFVLRHEAALLLLQLVPRRLNRRSKATCAASVVAATDTAPSSCRNK